MAHDSDEFDLTRLKNNRVTPLARDKWPQKLKDFRGGKRLILSCDGGGVRGIITLRCLRALEEHLSTKEVEVNCIDIFDMFAGTSTGAVIAGGLALGVSTDDLIDLYRHQHQAIFARNWPQSVVPFLIGVLVGLLVAAFTALPFWVPILGGVAAGWIARKMVGLLLVPKYNSTNLRDMLRAIGGDTTLAECPRDILIAATDTLRNETIYFSAFHADLARETLPDLLQAGWSSVNWEANVRGTYQHIRLRDAVLASAGSAPTYFLSLGRFIDGGVGSYNNPAYVAAVEALRYSANPVESGRFNETGEDDSAGEFRKYQHPDGDQIYRPGQVLVLSFGTGSGPGSLKQGEAKSRRFSLQWIEWVLNAYGSMAAVQQSYIVAQELAKAQKVVEFRRFDLHFNKGTIKTLCAFLQKNNHHPFQADLLCVKVDYGGLKLDAVEYFDFLDRVGQAFGEYLKQETGFNESKTLGDPVLTNPRSFHIDIYKECVRKELEQDNP